MSKLRKQPIAERDDRDFSREPGDRVYAWAFGEKDGYAVMFDLKESRGRNKRDAGELVPVAVKNGRYLRQAWRDDEGIWHWFD